MAVNGLSGMERKCHICGRVFMYRADWAYKKGMGDGIKLFCSWSCMRKYEKRKPDRISRTQKIQQALADGLNPKEIADLLAIDSRQVAYWQRKMEKEAQESNERETEPAAGGEEN